MARNPLRPGEIGKIRTEQVRPGLWRADASFCDRTGTKGRCRKSGRTATAARRALAEELKERIELENPEGLVTPTSLVNEAVETYLTNRMHERCMQHRDRQETVPTDQVERADQQA